MAGRGIIKPGDDTAQCRVRITYGSIKGPSHCGAKCINIFQSNRAINITLYNFTVLKTATSILGSN